MKRTLEKLQGFLMIGVVIAPIIGLYYLPEILQAVVIASIVAWFGGMAYGLYFDKKEQFDQIELLRRDLKLPRED